MTKLDHAELAGRFVSTIVLSPWFILKAIDYGSNYNLKIFKPDVMLSSLDFRKLSCFVSFFLCNGVLVGSLGWEAVSTNSLFALSKILQVSTTKNTGPRRKNSATTIQNKNASSSVHRCKG